MRGPQGLRGLLIGGSQALNVIYPVSCMTEGISITHICCSKKRFNNLRLQNRRIHFVDKKNLFKVISSDEIDWVAIAVPPKYQPPLAIHSLRSGKHIFCEKPLSLSTHSLLEIFSAASKFDRVVGVNLGFRFLEPFKQFSSILQEVGLDRAMLVTVDWMTSGRISPSLTYNWKNNASEGGGALSIMGIHVLDYLHWMCGELTALSARKFSVIKDRPLARRKSSPRKPVTADDFVQLTGVIAGRIPFASRICTVATGSLGHSMKVHYPEGVLELSNNAYDDTFDNFSIKSNQLRGFRWDLKPGLIYDRAPKNPGGGATGGRIATTFEALSEFISAVKEKREYSIPKSDIITVHQSLCKLVVTEAGSAASEL